MNDSQISFLKPIAHNTLQEQVYLRIRQGLIDGEFKPAQVLTIRGLASQLNTSVMPIREALQKLVAEHVLELLPSRSARVPSLSAHDFSEICEVRIVLEGHAATLAAERAKPLDIKRIETALEAFNSCKSGDNNSLIQLRNREFHFAIYAAAHQATLMGLIEPLWVRCGPCTLTFFEYLGSHAIKHSASDRHHKAFAAIRAGRTDEAKDAIIADIRATDELYQQEAPTSRTNST